MKCKDCKYYFNGTCSTGVFKDLNDETVINSDLGCHGGSLKNKKPKEPVRDVINGVKVIVEKTYSPLCEECMFFHIERCPVNSKSSLICEDYKDMGSVIFLPDNE